MPVTITRCSNNYGPYHFPEKLIPLIIKNILEGKPLPVYGDGSNVRDWLYVEDHCKAIDLVVRKGVEGEVYNVGGHNEKTNLEIVKLTIATIRRLMEEKPEYRAVLKKQVKGDDGDALKASTYSDLCYELAQDVEEETFPWTDEGVEALKTWYQSQYEKFLAAHEA